MSDKERFEISFVEVPNEIRLSIKVFGRCDCCKEERMLKAITASFPVGLYETGLTKELIISNLRGLASMIEKIAP